MKILETVFYGIPLTITYYRDFRDEFSPESGHYTVPSRWRIETIEHKDQDISDIVCDVAWKELERLVNE